MVDRLGTAFGLRIGLDGPEGKSVISLGEFARYRAPRCTPKAWLVSECELHPGNGRLAR